MQIHYVEYSLPSGWTRDKIGRRLKLNYGKSQAAIRSEDGSFPIYGTGGLIEYGTEYLVEGDSVLIGRKGTLDNPLYIDHPFWPVDTTYYTSDFDGDMKWFYYITQTLGLSALNEATGVPSLSRDTFYQIEIPFPPKAEQTAIAEVLATVDRAIEQTEALIAKQRRIKAGLMHDLLTRGIDEEGNLRHPSTHRFKQSPLGLIPVEWEVSSVREELDLATGFTLGQHRRPRLNRRKYLRVANVQREEITLDDVAELEAQDHEMIGRVLQVDDLLVVEGHASPKEIGRCARVTSEAAGLTFQNHLFRLRSFNVEPRYALAWLNSGWVRRYWQRYCGTSSGLNTINQVMLGALPIPIPQSQEQTAISDLLEREDVLIKMESGQLEKLRRLKTGLMQDLLTGRVSVEPLLKHKKEENQ